MNKKLLLNLSVLSTFFFVGMGVYKIINTSCDTIERSKKTIRKAKSNYLLCERWVQLKESGKRISRYLKDRNINTVAIYGFGNVGMNLYDELANDNMEVLYAIDKKMFSYNSNPPIKKIEDDLEKVDAVIVTVDSEFETIEKELSKKLNCPILPIEDVIYNV